MPDFQEFARQINEAVRSALKGEVPMPEKPARPPVGPSPLGVQDAKLRAEQRAHELAMVAIRGPVGETAEDRRFNREVLEARERRRKAAENPGVWRIGESPGTGGHTVYLGAYLAAVFLNPDLAVRVVATMNRAEGNPDV